MTNTTTTTPTESLAVLGLSLPPAPTAIAAYVPTLRVGDLLYVSGQLPVRDGAPIATGSMPGVDLETAVECAKVCTLNALAQAQAELGSIDNIVRVVRVGCFVASDAGFGGQPKVANGASELLQQIFGEAGRHARAAVGCSALPLNVPVEIEFLFQVR